MCIQVILMTVQNIDNVSKKLDIATSTIRKWERDFTLSIKRNSKNNRVFHTDDILLLQNIKTLKEQGLSPKEIAFKLNIGVSNHTTMKNSYKSNTGLDQDNNLYTNDKNLSKLVLDKIDSISDIARDYAKASYRIGQLESQLEAEKEKTLLISDNKEKDIQNVTNELTHTAIKIKEIMKQNELNQMELEKLKAENQKLTLELSQKNKPFWKRFK